MERAPMVRLATVGTGFHARVIAARLGADGIVTELRGAVDGPYPMGDVHVFVGQQDMRDASELLLLDELESAFDTDDDGDPAPRRRAVRARELCFAIAGLVAVTGPLVARAV